MDETAETAFADYIFDRTNPAGRHQELWHHGGGCRAHVLVTRDTLTHEVLSCEATGQWAGKGEAS